MDITQKIIRTYLYHALPRAVQEQFEQWCLDKDRSLLIESQLKQEWDQLDPKSVLDYSTADYRTKLNRLHQAIHAAKIQPTRRFSLRALVAASLVGLLLMTIEYVVVKEYAADQSVCLVTAESSKGRFALPDGSVVWLNANSQLTYSKRFARSGVREVKLAGEAFFDIRRDTLHPFDVQMGDLKVRVLGTRFNACFIPSFHTEEVTLQSGAVEITASSIANPILLSPNQHCAYDTESGQATVTEVESSNYYSWMNDSVLFENRTLADILTNIEHKYNIRFQIDDNVDTSVRLSFTLYPESLSETLTVIETLAHIHCRQIDPYYVWISQ